MKTYNFQINIGVRSFSVSVAAKSYDGARGIIVNKYPSGAIIAPL